MESLHYVIQWLCERHNISLLNKFEQFDTIKDFINSLNDEELTWIKETINKECIIVFNEDVSEDDIKRMKAMLEIKHLISNKS